MKINIILFIKYRLYYNYIYIQHKSTTTVNNICVIVLLQSHSNIMTIIFIM